jgi:cyanate lyase
LFGCPTVGITKRADLTSKILDIKREKGWTWKYICSEIGGYSPILITAALLGEMKLTKPQAAAAGRLFGLTNTEHAFLNEAPYRGSVPMPPNRLGRCRWTAAGRAR